MDKIKLLIVDDSYYFIKSAANFLSLYDEVEVLGGAISSDIAIKMTESMKPDLILLDLSVPDFTGLDLLLKLKEMLPSLKVIITTIEDCEEYKERCLRIGADDFISKSDFGSHIIHSIHSLFNYSSN